MSPSVPRIIARFCLAAAPAVVAMQAGAATIIMEPGDFSSNWFAPTEIDGADQISGVASDLDVLKLTGLATGAQTISVDVSGAAAYTGGSFYAGGSLLYSYTPFQWAWDQDGSTGYGVGYNEWNVGTPWYGSTGSLTSTSSILLDSSFGGTIYLAFVPTYGGPLSYTINATAAAGVEEPVAPASVPLPAAGLLMAGALAGLGALSRRRA